MTQEGRHRVESHYRAGGRASAQRWALLASLAVSGAARPLALAAAAGAPSCAAFEHEHLRKDFGEPRVHFAIVCASVTCPPLRSEAYRAADLDRQLDDQARRFLADPSRNRFDRRSRTLHLSSIFKWFREDFEKAAGSLPAFVARYVDPATAAAVEEPSVRIEFVDYDWSLNGR